MDSYDVRFWDIKRLGNGTAARYRVRWAVDGREHCKSFKARPLADGFLDGLKDAVRDRRPFSPRTGLPEAGTTADELVTWYQHARTCAEAKWGNLAPVSRRSVAGALVTVTIALTAREPGAPEGKVLRQALFAWAFNPATRDTSPPEKIAHALDWAERASLPVAELEDTATVRLALGACARTLTGKAAAIFPGGPVSRVAGLNAQPNSACRSTLGSGAPRSLAVSAMVTVTRASATDRRETGARVGHLASV